jgi:hypothetical protein
MVEESYILPLQENTYGPPVTMDESYYVESAMKTIPLAIAKCDGAGKGPDPPDPPEAAAEGSEVNEMKFENFDVNDSEAQPRMAFAKMPVPDSMYRSYTLVDDDFNIEDFQDTDDKVAALPAKLQDQHISDQLELTEVQPEIPLEEVSRLLQRNDSMRLERSSPIKKRHRNSINNRVSKPEVSLSKQASDMGLWSN